MIDVPILPRGTIRAKGEQSVALERDILTPQQVAEYLQLTPDTVYRYIREGKLAAAKLGRHYRIPKENVELLLLVSSTAGSARMRVFSRQEVEEWLEEDEIDQETRTTGETLLADLRNQR
jgi:excisionase family DNA binding protein